MAVQPGSCRTRSEIPKTGFLRTRLIYLQDMELLDLEDYRHNFVNLTCFRLVKSEDDFTRKIIDDIYLYSENTQLPILNGSKLSVSKMFAC